MFGNRDICIIDALKQASIFLKQNHIENETFEARLLLSHILNVESSYLFTHSNELLTVNQLKQFANLLQKRANKIPYQYIVNSAEFMGIEFYVDENVLIPRPDTEIMVEHIIEDIKQNSGSVNALELCTGSGCISIALAKFVQNIQILAVDISDKALEIAYKNAKTNNTLDKITFIKSDMFENVSGKFQILAANPPYLSIEDMNSLQLEVKNEPSLALYGGDDGLDFYRLISKNASNYLEKEGKIFLEIGIGQHNAVEQLLLDNGFCNINLHKDYSGIIRVVEGTYL